MLLAIDVGNTNIVLGVFDGKTLTESWRLQTLRERTADEIGILVTQLFSQSRLDKSAITGIVLSSVVPPLTGTMQEMAERYFGRAPLTVDPATNTGPAAPGYAPAPRTGMSVIWTGTHVIAWGGAGAPNVVNTGDRYDPALDAWTSTSTLGAPPGRSGHSAVWTGSRMLVWGGQGIGGGLVDGGRYDPVADTWTSMSTTNAPPGRNNASAVWPSVCLGT